MTKNENKSDPLVSALESLREEDKTVMGDVSEPAPVADFNRELHECNQELERQVAKLTSTIEMQSDKIGQLNVSLEKHFNVIRDLASAMTTR